MGYTKFLNGFTITSSAAIDRRIYLSKAEMLTAEDNFNLPAVYFCICTDDGKFYIYNENNTPNSVTGKYRVLDESIEFTTDAAKAQLNEAIKNSVEIGNIKTEVATIEQNLETVASAVVDVTEKVNVIEPKVTNLETRVDTLEPKVTDLEPRVITLETNIAKAEEDISDIQSWIENVKLDGGEIKAEYSLNPTLVYVNATGVNPTTVVYKNNAELSFAAMSGHVLPDEVEVNGTRVGADRTSCTGTTASWNKSTGKLLLETVTADINYIIIGE